MRRRLMFLSHRMPYPPNKGEKIRAWHMLTHLAARFDISLGCVVDDPADMAHVPMLKTLCADVAAYPINRPTQKLRALIRARPSRPLMPDFYHAPALQRWVNATLAEHSIDFGFIYTVAMAPYLAHASLPVTILDAVDIDSEKWGEYATQAAWPARVLWAREARNLLAYECQAATKADATLFVSQAEAARFVTLAPDLKDLVHFVENGVDLDRFSPVHQFASPFSGDGPALVFTGHMDYWPNADAAAWFAEGVMPTLRARQPDATFWIVGANPGPAVRNLAALPGVHVTGRVDDTRPYMAHATACVCPLRLARGIQNKVLEGMAMGRPVIASPAAFEGIRAEPGRDLLVAETAEEFVAAISSLTEGAHAAMGSAARQAMLAGYDWESSLAKLDGIMAASKGGGKPPPSPAQ